jgi:hypothetical protein
VGAEVEGYLGPNQSALDEWQEAHSSLSAEETSMPLTVLAGILRASSDAPWVSWHVSHPTMCTDPDPDESSEWPLGSPNASDVPLATFEAVFRPPLWHARHEEVTREELSPVRRSIELVARWTEWHAAHEAVSTLARTWGDSASAGEAVANAQNAAVSSANAVIQPRIVARIGTLPVTTRPIRREFVPTDYIFATSEPTIRQD